ncbi:zinc finger protein 853-like [Cyclospora cayetanensis]|uniref:Zinc finger protein 853-like n=1 Tax=Cyclospora cayetanensis TaxID=88456 RepID=A0A6P6RSV9_9EIME|nr:zinc finger protein 853-like [Cyclospora cayetanensis]
MAFINRLAAKHMCPLWIKGQVREASHFQARKLQQQKQQQQQQELIAAISEINFGPQVMTHLNIPPFSAFLFEEQQQQQQEGSGSVDFEASSPEMAVLLKETVALEETVLQQMEALIALLGEGRFEPLFPLVNPTDIFQVDASAATHHQQQQQQQQLQQQQLLQEVQQAVRFLPEKEQTRKAQKKLMRGAEGRGLLVRRIAQRLKTIDDLVRQWLSLPSSDTSAVYSAVQQQLLHLLTQRFSGATAATATATAATATAATAATAAQRPCGTPADSAAMGCSSSGDGDMLWEADAAQLQAKYLQRLGPLLCSSCTVFDDMTGECLGGGGGIETERMRRRNISECLRRAESYQLFLSFEDPNMRKGAPAAAGEATANSAAAADGMPGDYAARAASRLQKKA